MILHVFPYVSAMRINNINLLNWIEVIFSIYYVFDLQGGWTEENWEEEMEKHPFFATQIKEEEIAETVSLFFTFVGVIHKWRHTNLVVA